MATEQDLGLLKALADRSRMRILGALSQQPRCGEELVQRLKLAPSTVSSHLRRLEEAGLVERTREQYYVVYRLKPDRLSPTLMELVAPEEADRRAQDERTARYRRKVLRAFLREGRLVSIPSQRRKRRILLEEILQRLRTEGLFEPGTSVPERELNRHLVEYHDDVCFLRREMICEGLLERAGGEYWSPRE